MAQAAIIVSNSGRAGDEVLRPGSKFGPENDLIELGEEVGSGAAAKVYVCRVIRTGEQLAVKVINLGKLRLLGDFDSHMVKLDREVTILQELHHPRIVNLRTVYRTSQWVFLVMELVQGGELFDAIVKSKTLNEIEAKYIFRQLLEGVGYMHSRKVIHRDLKPENILIASSQDLEPPQTGKLRDVKIADFGLSKIINEGTSYARTFVGTPQYWAPEVLNVQQGGGSYTQAADYWSLGAVLFVMLGGRYPFDGKAMPLEEQIRTATFSMTSAAWQRVSEEAKDMVRGLLKVNPNERLKLEDCMVHPWLAGSNSPMGAQAPKLMVTEMSSGTPTAGTGPVPVVTQPSVDSAISGRSESAGNHSSGSNERPSQKAAPLSPETRPEPDAAHLEVPVVQFNSEASPDEEKDAQDIIFCLNELLKLQVSIAGSLEMANLAFRHADPELSDDIRRTFNQARKLSDHAVTVVSNYAQVAQQVSRNILPDLKLAIQEKEPSLAVSLLGIVKDWVANMKKEGEEMQSNYSALQESVHNLIINAQHAKSGADRRLIEAVKAAGSDGQSHQLALGQGQPSPHAVAGGLGVPEKPAPISDVDTSGLSLPTQLFPAIPQTPVAGGSSMPRSRAPGDSLVGSNERAINVPSTMNMWTRNLFEQLSAVEEGRKSTSGGDQPMAGAGIVTADAEEWKSDVLDLLFMAPGVGPALLPKHEALKEEDFLHRAESVTEDGQSRSVRGHAESAASTEDVTMADSGPAAAPGAAIVRYVPGGGGNSSVEEAVVGSSTSLLRALRELKRVDEILQGCSAFWANMDGTVQKLAQMKEHTECLVNFANSSKPLRERFEQRLNEYTTFWTSLERLCRQYCVDHQSASKRMYEVIREVSDAADKFDTAQSVRLGMALAYREKQRRHSGYG
eukprot:TRINITY_DN29388_c0_g2_i1.p1 TRINITY_DN29388_c0_g2~~TRINITY_DN29388_c0_g2_i1.p1  ORF type:complete len:920 (+),score=224.05 TRINITY_DN29388_c0_g2_i1:53-2761(+)